MKQYILKYSPPRETFTDDATPEESAAVERHFAYLNELLNSGKLIIAGRTEDAEYGIAIFAAEDDEEAEVIMNNDPAIMASVFTGILKQFRVALFAGE